MWKKQTNDGEMMGIYYFAVDHNNKQQMWAPGRWSDKCIHYPGHPLPAMVAMENRRGSSFEFTNDMAEDSSFSYKDVTEEVYKEWKECFKDFDWTEYEKYEKNKPQMVK